mgnify:CR=1 FL=1
MQWDVFVRVIDNYGDVGVCWRLACGLVARGEQVRLWLDDPSALAWMAPGPVPGVSVQAWAPDSVFVEPGEVLVEAFGCDPAPEFIATCAESARAGGRFHAWINLEYLSAEPFVERTHGLPSPVLSGPGQGPTKHFFYPGFTPRTGGLLREPTVSGSPDPQRARAAWFAERGHADTGERLISLFCYEPAALVDFLANLAKDPLPTRLLVTPGRARAAVDAAWSALDQQQPAWNQAGLLRREDLPWLTQPRYDRLLAACDFNLVRGEDSLVRAIWAGRPFAWQIYPQDDGAHAVKLAAFLDQLQAPDDWRGFHAAWNGLQSQALPRLQLDVWGEAVLRWRQQLLRQDDLVSQLLRFATKKR